VDKTKLVDPNDRSKHDAALLLLSQEEVKAHVQDWFGDFADLGIVVAYIDKQTRNTATYTLHINFKSINALSHALGQFAFLVRCGSASTAWGQSKNNPCGPARHAAPELLQFHCTLTPHQSKGLPQLLPEVERVVRDDMGLKAAAVWFPTTHDPGRQSELRSVTFNVLPRFADSANLRAAVQRLHQKFKLWGAVLRVHAPNHLELQRCNQCGQFGHSAPKCPLYNGIGLRLLFKAPLPWAALQELQHRTGATRGYLGASVEDMKPHRKVTLLFDATEDWTALFVHLEPVLDGLLHLLHEAPTEVKPYERQRECKECGSTERPHTCPFI
jgi:hypothetical protein